MQDLGAEFTQVDAKHFGSRIVPSPVALPTAEEAGLSKKSPMMRGKRNAREPQDPNGPPRQPKEKHALGSTGSQMTGIGPGIYHALRRKRQPVDRP